MGAKTIKWHKADKLAENVETLCSSELQGQVRTIVHRFVTLTMPRTHSLLFNVKTWIGEKF